MDYEAIFIEWWKQSYPFNPGAHAVMTHTAFAQYVSCLHNAQNAQNAKADSTE
jgi:hypothetical protein